MEMEIQFLENPLGIESDTSQDEDVVLWDGVLWEEDDWPPQVSVGEKIEDRSHWSGWQGWSDWSGPSQG